MSTGTTIAPAGNPRIAGRRGQVVNLDVDFYNNGTLFDPYAIRQVDIYKTQVLPYNLVATFLIANPTDILYPLPAVRLSQGAYILPWNVPVDAYVPDIYFDVWSYYATNPCIGGTGLMFGGSGGTGTNGEICNLEDQVLVGQLLSCCHRFWVYPDNFACMDQLQVIDFGFEPLKQQFNSPSRSWLEVGLMPLPLYDFNTTLVMPLIPMLQATITVETRYCETLVKDMPMLIGLRQGSYRTNPFELKFLIDTSLFLIGSYKYRVTIWLPDGTSRTSGSFILTIN